MRRSFDFMTMLGVLIAIGGILSGQVLEGGHPGMLFQTTAFMIVIVGSFGAVLVATPRDDVYRGMRFGMRAFFPPRQDLSSLREQLLQLASLARREGLLSLEEFSSRDDCDPFLAKCLGHALDGNNAEALRSTVETDMAVEEQDAVAGARFWENWGALCPTIGVLGAVVGLIQVMENLGTPSKIGPGIAVAFVATVYGVGFANLICIPLALKLKRYVEREQVRRYLVLEGVVGIQSGMSPSALRNRLTAYMSEQVDAAE